MAKFAGVTLTPETIQKTRELFAENQRQCAKLSQEYGSGPIQQDGGFYVNGHSQYVVKCEKDAIAALAGEWDHSLTFLQRAHYVQTGESIALLP